MAAVAGEMTEERARSAREEAEARRWRTWFRHGGRGLAVVVALAVIAIALIGFGIVSYLRVHDADVSAQRRTAAADAARQVVVNLTSVDQATAQRDIQRVVDGATGTFRDQFSQQAGAYQKMLLDSQVSSAGKVVESGVTSIDGDKAVVLAAATATVKNKDAPAGEQRVYRMRLSLQNENDRWMVSKLEFVA